MALAINNLLEMLIAFGNEHLKIWASFFTLVARFGHLVKQWKLESPENKIRIAYNSESDEG